MNHYLENLSKAVSLPLSGLVRVFDSHSASQELKTHWWPLLLLVPFPAKHLFAYRFTWPCRKKTHCQKPALSLSESRSHAHRLILSVCLSENRAEIGFPYGFPRVDARTYQERATEDPQFAREPFVSRFSARFSIPHVRKSPTDQRNVRMKTAQKWTRARHSKGRERPPVLGRAAAPALRALEVAPALHRVHSVVRAVLPASIGTNPNRLPQRFYPPSKSSNI